MSAYEIEYRNYETRNGINAPPSDSASSSSIKGTFFFSSLGFAILSAMC